MASHIVDGKFQSDKYPTCPADKVPLSVNDQTAQDLLWQYAQRRRRVDAEFAGDLEARLLAVGYLPGVANDAPTGLAVMRGLRLILQHLAEGGHNWTDGTDMKDVAAAEVWLGGTPRKLKAWASDGTPYGVHGDAGELIAARARIVALEAEVGKLKILQPALETIRDFDAGEATGILDEWSETVGFTKMQQIAASALSAAAIGAGQLNQDESPR